MFDLNGRVVLVTGAARGIGRAIALGAGRSGAHVIALDCLEDGLRSLQGELGAERCMTIHYDLENLDGIPAVFRDAAAWRGRVDALVNNAGIYERADFDFSFEDWSRSWQRTTAINLIAPAHLCREAVLHFRGRGGGTIINIASRAGFRGDGPDYTHYAASKGALLALTRTIARGCAREKILAYAIAPGFVNTALNDEFFKTHGTEGALREIPLAEMAQPEDIAATVLFLISGQARHATGATFHINGASYVH
ncbi:MAG TPA: SDR family oxidoreductase [Kofleriaceae bacterium]